MDSKEISSLPAKKIIHSSEDELAENNKCSEKKKITSSQLRRYQRKKALKRKLENHQPIAKESPIILKTTISELQITEHHIACSKVNEPTNLLEKSKTIKMDPKNSDKTKEELKVNKTVKNSPKSEVPGIAEIKKMTPDTKKENESTKRPNKNKSNEISNLKSVKSKAGSVNSSQILKAPVNNLEQASPEIKTPDSQINTAQEKSKTELRAERKAKQKADKENVLAAKTQNKSDDTKIIETKCIEDCKVVSAPTGNIKVDIATQEKSKAELRAERRAKQEEQRAAKVLFKDVKTKPVATKVIDKQNEEKPKTLPSVIVDVKKAPSPDKAKNKLIPSQHKVKLFNHLYGAANLCPSIPLNSKEIHPAIVRLGVQYASHIVMGSNARCIALLNALKQVIQDYTLPPNVEFSRGLEAHLGPCIHFLKLCRLPAVSMNNAIKHLKWQLTQLPNTISEYDAKTKLNEAIDTYVRDQIEVAGEAITNAVHDKISNGDVILTYGCSSLVESIITKAVDKKTFRVVVVAAHPWNEGREMLRRLTAKGVKCSLIMISALSFVMREINKVILGAGALLANGYVMARAGTAQVAMLANAHNVPVLVCCETHKFSERVQTDSFVYNEIGNPDDLIKCNPSHKDSPLSNWRAFNSLTLLNLTYDVTPPDLVTAVVTELAILPCTSVPVILRIKPSEF